VNGACGALGAVGKEAVQLSLEAGGLVEAGLQVRGVGVRGAVEDRRTNCFGKE